MAGKVGLFAVMIEDGEDLRRTSVRLEPVRGHGGELDRLPRQHQDGSRAQGESDGAAEDGEPLVARMHLRCRRLSILGEAHLADRDAPSVAFAGQQPERRAAHRLGFGADDDILIALGFDELIERCPQRLRDRDELFQHDSLATRLDATERRR